MKTKLLTLVLCALTITVVALAAALLVQQFS